MHPLIEKLLKNGPAVTDGSWGTQLQHRGLKRGECPDSWNLSHPEGVEEVARQYVEAGSQIVLTNTFGGSRLSLGRFNLGDKAVAINTAGVEISKKAAGNRAAVFASIGPTGKMLLTKETTEEELQNAFEEQADAQARAGADGIIVETMIDITEAGIAARASKRTGLPVIASNVGGLPEVVLDGATGRLVPPADPAALAQALLQLLADRQHWRDMGDAGRRRVERLFAVDTLLSRHLQLYHQLLAEQGRNETR